MRILNWMQNKFAGRPTEKKSKLSSSSRYSKHDAPKEEFSDWPQGLLAIGTFGNNHLKEDLVANEVKEDLEICETSKHSQSSENLSNFTEEEVGKLETELTKLLVLRPNCSTTESGEEVKLLLDRFLNCPSSLEVDRRHCLKFCDDLSDEEGKLTRNNRFVLSKGKDVHTDGKKSIKQKSISFVLKKLFVCHKVSSPTYSLRDPTPEPRMEKLLRTILKKKIYCQNNGSTSTRRYLVNRHDLKMDKEDEMKEKTKEGYKWVKTDSDFIVLEM